MRRSARSPSTARRSVTPAGRHEFLLTVRRHLEDPHHRRRIREGAAMSRRLCLLAWLLVIQGAWGTLVAHADVDLTGSSALSFGSTPAARIVIAQQGTGLGAILETFLPIGGNGVILVRRPMLGSIDQPTGTFVLDGSYNCLPAPAAEVGLRLSGTAPADGVFSGTLEVLNSVGHPCYFPPIAVSATRVSALCGNGVVDAGEACDVGVPPGSAPCCTLACTALAAGSSCPDDGLFCTADTCDGAGTCAHPPGHGGAVCRVMRFPCDVAEVCDGVSASCPPDQPTCPPPDIDVTGTWHVIVQNSFVGPLTFDISIAQTSIDLVVNGVPGWLDPVSRSFSALADARCQVFVGTGSNGFTGTFDAAGESFSGAQHYLFEKITPPPFCNEFADPATGTRLATSPDCGNGVLDAGEACDPGIAGSTCCYTSCTLKPSGAICRQSVDACDAAETCDGIVATCPADQANGGPDSDGDGMPDACDVCVGGAAASKPGLKLSTDKLLLRGRAAIPGGTLDPITNGVRLLITSATGTTLV